MHRLKTTRTSYKGSVSLLILNNQVWGLVVSTFAKSSYPHTLESVFWTIFRELKSANHC